MKKNQDEADLLKGFYFTDPLTSNTAYEFKKYEISGKSISRSSIIIGLPSNCSLFYRNTESINDTGQQAGGGVVRLQLGSIEIDLGTFMKLQTGMSIECDLPDGFPASLDFGNQKFAGVNAYLDGQKLKLIVTNIATS